MRTIPAEQVRHLDLDSIEKASERHFWLHIINNALGGPIRLPVIVKKGAQPGPVLGVTAALHGNEINGIPVIQNLMDAIDVKKLSGTVVGVLVVNVPGLLLRQRYFNDHADLNRIAPGKNHGNESEIFMHRFLKRVGNFFEYHFDLHTASFGRKNAHYIRAFMDDPQTARMAKLQGAQIIVSKPPRDKTLRGILQKQGTKSITIELKDPHVFQKGVIEDATQGILNVVYDLKMMKGKINFPKNKTYLCQNSQWLYTNEGGILRVFPEVGTRVSVGEPLAEVHTIFGETTKQYFAKKDAVVVGKSIDPLNQTGSRIIHLGYDFTEIDMKKFFSSMT
ncbi:MAG: succinylglutamate desuccinylase/aspartoacylase family protein [Bdellovibrionales bacterium]|nr:succinylglutamate desuccinylase/aspartoacylase family protein [Bdellovibrionales bacterium]